MIKLNNGGNNHGEKKKAKINICTIFLLAVCLCFLPVVSAETYKQSFPIDLKFTCTLNNAIPSSSATYNITLVYPNGTTFINNKVATPQGQGLFNYTTAFTEIGTYKVHSFCYDGVYSYSNSEDISITESGETFDITQSFGLIGQLVLIILFAGIGLSFSKEKWKMRTFFFMMSIIMGIITLNSVRIIMGSSAGLSSMGLSGLIIGIVVLAFMILYMMIYATKEVFDYFKKKKERRWNAY